MTEKATKPKKAAIGVQFEVGETMQCPHCSQTTKLTGWAAAHWDEDIAWGCPSMTCSWDRTQVSMRSGLVTMIVPENLSTH